MSDMDALEARVDALSKRCEHLSERVDDLEAERDELQEQVTSLVRESEDRLHRERSKLTRRVAALEDDIGIAATDALATAEGGEEAHRLDKLGRLVRHGVDSVAANPAPKMHRAKTLVENWSRWGTVRNDAIGKERRLASAKHNLKTRLEDARNESLQWSQVYRAMKLVDDWSDNCIKLVDGSSDEGKHVLVHTMEDEEAAEQ